MKKLCLLLAVVGVSLLAMGSTPLQVVSPTGSTSPQYDTLVTVISSNCTVTRTASRWPAAIDDSVKTVAWAQVVGSTLADSFGYSPSHADDILCAHGTAIPPQTATSAGAFGMMYFPWDRDDREVVSAYIGVYVHTTNTLELIANTDTMFCFADTSATHSGWHLTTGQTRWSSSPLWPNRANVSYNSMNGAPTAWNPVWSALNNVRKIGPSAIATNDTIDDGWLTFDVTDILSGDFNIYGWIFMIKKGSAGTYTKISNLDDATKATRPFMVVRSFAKTRRGFWPNGSNVAACFIFDDGAQPGFDHYAKIADSLGIAVTFAPELNDVLMYTTSTVQPEKLLEYVARGHEVASQGWFTTLQAPLLHGALGGSPDSTAELYKLTTFKSAVTNADTISIQLSKTDSLFSAWGLPAAKTYVFPFGYQADDYADSLEARGYIAARSLTAGSTITWSSGYVYKVPVVANPLSGWYTAGNEATTRAKVRAEIRKFRHPAGASYGGVIVFYGHSYSDARFTEVSWIIDELLDNDVYVGRFDKIMEYWRRHHTAPEDPEDEWTGGWK